MNAKGRARMGRELDARVVSYAEETEKEGDEPTMRTFRCRRDYRAGVLAERRLVRAVLNDKLRELKVQLEHTRGLIHELERIVNPRSG